MVGLKRLINSGQGGYPKTCSLLAGYGGRLKPGRNIVYKPGRPMTNLHMTLLDRMGAHPEKIGDSTGKLEYLSEI